MYPVYGPTLRTSSGLFWDAYRKCYRQTMPINMPLEYQYQFYRGYDSRQGSEIESSLVKFNSYSFANWISAREWAYAHSQAYGELVNRLSDTAGWLENIAQAGKARDMIVLRAVQLGQFAKHLKRADFKKAAKVLSSPIPSGASARKKASQNFLEWEYGWKPIISDLESSLKLLCSDPGVRRLKGSGTHRLDAYETYVNTGPGIGDSQRSTYIHSGFATVTLRTGVRVTNPNVFLASRLGLLDLALPWKLLPFSFVVDWFVNVEQVISSATDWFGVEMIHPTTTEFSKGGIRQTHFTGYRNLQGGDHYVLAERVADSVEMRRMLGISAPTLHVKPFRGFSMQRGAQAIALVLAVLGR
jgi:hypothetical protein